MQFPDLTLTPFYWLSIRFELTFEPQQAAKLWPTLRESRFSRPVLSSTGKPYEHVVIVEFKGNTGEMELVVRPDLIAEVGLSTEEVGPSSHVSDEQFEARLAAFQKIAAGEQDFETTCGFLAKLHELPPFGIVRRGLGAKANFGDKVLRLIGAQFLVDEDFQQTISWYDDGGPGSIEGQVKSLTTSVIGPRLLVDVVESAQQLYHRYIAETEFAASG